MTVFNRLEKAVSSLSITKVPPLKPEKIKPIFFARRNEKLQNSLKTASKNLNQKPSALFEAIQNQDKNFQRKVSREYLQPLSNHNFKRLKLDTQYDNYKAINFTRALREMEKSKESNLFSIYSIEYKQFLAEMITLLVKSSQNIVNSRQTKNENKYWKYTMTEVPPIPNFKEHPESFTKYIGLLTHTNFLFKNSSRLNGIIPKILRNLMHPANVETFHLRNIQVYNDLIFFFGEHFDLAACREIYSQITIEGCTPNSMTFNLLLRNIIKNTHIRKSQYPYRDIIFFLKQMQNYKVNADIITWTTCYNFLKDSASQEIFIEQMERYKIPINERFIYTVLKNSKSKLPFSLEDLKQRNIKITRQICEVFLDNLLVEKKYKDAMTLIKEYHFSSPEKLKITARMMNKILIYLANESRLDLSIITYNTFLKEYGVKPDSVTFKQLYKCLARNGYSKNFFYVFYVIKKWQNDNGLGFRNSYWRIKCDSISKFNCRVSNFKEDRVITIEYFMKGLIWGKDVTYTENLWNECSPTLRRNLRILGCIPNAIKGKKQKQFKKFQTLVKTKDTSRKKLAYRKTIASTAIKQAVINRSDYSKDWYKTFKQELETRNII